MTDSTSDSNRRIARNTLMLYIRMFLIMGVTLYTSRVVLNQLGVVDYGIYNVVGGIVVALAFLNGSMTQSTQRFLSYEIGIKNNDNIKKIFSHSIFIHLFIGIIIIALAETIGLWFLKCKMVIPPDKQNIAFWVYQFSIIAFLISVFQVPFNAAIISFERIRFYAAFGIIEVILKLIVALSLYLIVSNRLFWYSLMMMILYLIITLGYIIYCYCKITQCRIIRSFEKGIFLDMTSFAGWNTLGALVGVLKNQGFNIVLNLFFGPIVNASYGITNQVLMAISSFNQNFMTALNPQIIKNYASKDFMRFRSLLYRGCKISFFLILIVSLPILLDTTYILKLWLGQVPEYAPIFIKFIIFNALLESYTYPIGTAIQANGHIRNYQLLVSGINLTMLPIAYIFFKMGYNPNTGFIVMICVSFCSLIARFYFIKSLLKFKVTEYLIDVILPTLICFGIMSFIVLLGNKLELNTFQSYIGYSFILLVIALIIIYTIGFSASEKKFLISLILHNRAH